MFGIVRTSDSDSDEYVFGCQDKPPKQESKRPTSRVKLQNSHLTVLVDSGASCNVMDKRTFDNLHTKPQLKRATTKLYSYGITQPLKLYGQFNTVIESHTCYTNATFYVANGDNTLLSYETAVDLTILNKVHAIDDIHTQIDTNLKGISDVIGTYKGGVIKLHIDESVKPTAQPHRRIPFHMRKKVEKELQRLMDSDVIEKVTDGPTPWVSPIVVAPKPKTPENIRICVDMRLPNKVIKRERHITPTFDDVIADLSGAQYFSKLDLRSGYHQILLHTDSRHITTFSTHAGLYRYKRLNFGINSAAEILQETVRESLRGSPGVVNISDDILVKGDTIAEHDANLLAAILRLKENGFTVN